MAKPIVKHAPHTCIKIIDANWNVLPWPTLPSTKPVPIRGIDDINCKDLHAGDAYVILSEQVAAQPISFTVSLNGGTAEHAQCHSVSDDQGRLYGCEWHTILVKGKNQELTVRVADRNHTVTLGDVADTCHGNKNKACWKAIAADYARLEARIITDPPRLSNCADTCSVIIQVHGDERCKDSCTQTLNMWLRPGDGREMGSHLDSTDMSPPVQNSIAPSIEAVLTLWGIMTIAALVKHIRVWWLSR